jgi:hypothetical protein
VRIGNKAWPAVGLVTALFVVPVVVASSADSKGGRRDSGGRAIAHSDGTRVDAGRLPMAQTFSVGGHALEPTIGLDGDGNAFYAAAGFDQVGELPKTEVLRSTDQGKTWEVTSPRVLGQNAMPITLDPYVYVDKKTGRVFTIDLTVACSYMSFSDDQGESWITNPLACGRPVNDHQTLFMGPAATSSPTGYENVVYYCWNDVGSSACSKSLDGGLTFHPTGTPAFSGYEPGSEDPGFFGVDGFCGGLHGHGAVGPDGSVYLPREYCGLPMVAISRDEGTTWTQVRVSKMRSPAQPTEGAPHPSVEVDAKGNVYYMWIGQKDRLPYLTVSRDKGKTWSDPILVGPPGLKEANLPQIDTGDPGKIALVYYGSTNSPYPKCRAKCNAGDYRETTWNAYVTISANALSSRPVFLTGTVNVPRDPLIRGECGPGRCQWAYDFIDVSVGPDGVAYGAFVDGCMSDCSVEDPRGEEYEGLVTKLVGGPRLR